MTEQLALRERLLAFMEDEAADEFEALSLAIFAHQFACNTPYRAYCESRGVTPQRVSSWAEIPAVPTDGFRSAALVCGDAARAEAVFRTSGTTGGEERRGAHYVPDLRPYHRSLKLGFARHLLPDGSPRRILSLVPPREELPDSSLSHMVSEVMDAFGAPGSGYFFSAERGIAFDALVGALGAAAAGDEPVLLAGTSFAFVHLFDHLGDHGLRFRLPAASRAVDTGGFKGRSREVDRNELISWFPRYLEIEPSWVVNEYGMTEMGSQFYDGVAGMAGVGGERLHVGPHWLRTRAVDPETLEPLPSGATGVLRHWDLANLNSVLALQTADLGTVSGRGIKLLGRATGAEARGCSIAVDELLQAVRRG